jgi:two-component system cell cycle response regulator
MNISILVFGSDNFFATLPDQIRDATVFRVEVAANLNQAISRIQLTPPDVLLVQASCDGSKELGQWLKAQIKLAWIYCIFLEDRQEHLMHKMHRGWEWEWETTSSALQQGADAYIWYLPETHPHNGTKLSAANRLLLSQLMVGFRKAQKYRELMRTNDLLSTIALADPLTELNNRRALEWELPRHVQKARNYSTPLSLIILDVDFFKKVNDTYGHLVGDRLLQSLCSRLRHNMRFQDTPFRYGGEEFVILLGNTTCSEAMLVAHRLNHLISEQPFAIDSNLSLNITISLGTACLQPEDDNKGVSLLQRADECLLQAKANGRNCVVGCKEEKCHDSPVPAVSS